MGRQLSKNQRNVRELVVSDPEQSTSGSMIESDWARRGLSRWHPGGRHCYLGRRKDRQTVTLAALGSPLSPGPLTS